jgi:hypothetical protein
MSVVGAAIVEPVAFGVALACARRVETPTAIIGTGILLLFDRWPGASIPPLALPRDLGHVLDLKMAVDYDLHPIAWVEHDGVKT